MLAIERVFFQVNVRTAMSVGQASGIALAEASRDVRVRASLDVAPTGFDHGALAPEVELVRAIRGQRPQAMVLANGTPSESAASTMTCLSLASVSNASKVKP